MGKASLILAVLAILISFIPVLGLPGALILGLLSIGLGIAGAVKKDKKGQAVSGIIISGVAIMIAFAWSALIVGGVNEAVEGVSEAIEESETEAVVELESNVLKTFNADTTPEAMEIVGNLESWENAFSSFEYKAETPETCQYYRDSGATLRSYVEAQEAEEFSFDGWTDYSKPITMDDSLHSHLLSQNCGEWTLIEEE